MTVKCKTHVGPDGMLHLHLPVDILDADVEVEINIERQQAQEVTGDDCCVDEAYEDQRRELMYDD